MPAKRGSRSSKRKVASKPNEHKARKPKRPAKRGSRSRVAKKRRPKY